MDALPTTGTHPRHVTATGSLLRVALDRAPFLLVALAAARGLLLLASSPFLQRGDLEQAAAGARGSVAILLVAAMLLGAWRLRGEGRGVRLLLAVIGILATVGSVVGTLEGSLAGTTSPEGTAFLAAAVLLVLFLTPITIRGAPRSLLLTAWLDTVLFLASATIGLGVAWGSIGGSVMVPDLLVVGALVTVAAWSAAGLVLLLHRAVRFGRGGPYAVMAGVALVALGGLGYLASLDARGLAPFSLPTEACYLGGLVLAAWGGLTWTLEPDPRVRASLLATLLRDGVPTLAIIGTIVLFVVVGEGPPHLRLGFDIARVALVTGVLLAGVREMVILVYEKRAVAAERAAEAELAAHVAERHQITKALAGLEAGPTVAETADRICRRAVGLPGIDFVILALREGAGSWRVAGAAGVALDDIGDPVSPLLAGDLEGMTSGAVWREDASRWLDGGNGGGVEGQGEVVGIPLGTEGGIIGALLLGSRTAMGPNDAERRLITIRGAAMVAAALLAPAVAVEAALRERREHIEGIIAAEAFHPVFQPIVDLATREVKGFEALTRFADGTRPDLVFEEATRVGRGLELELATLAAAMGACATLPPDAYVSVNLSAELASRPELLGPVLTRMPRDLLLEITEHVPVEDYELLMASLYALDLRVRIAVDDAGSGYSGLAHILAVRPHVVKLDQSLVRSVDLDLARQALVGAMVGFTVRTGAVVVAEGVETEGEAEMLRTLGAHLGQGYLFGRPQLAPEAVPAAGTAATGPAPN